MTEGPADPGSIAAVDLGSNSFHMVVGRLDRGEVRVVDKLRERVQLAAALDESGHLSAQASERALACLERFGQRVRDLPAENVRAIGTSALRRAKNRAHFIEQAERALGHRVDIVSGQEEARLVYRGVLSSVPQSDAPRLVIDIGGGSTECILGQGEDILLAESLSMGCVVFTQRFFPGGRIDQGRMKAAELAAALELRPIRYRFRDAGWSETLGASGTILAAERIARAMDPSQSALTLKGMARLGSAILHARHVDKLSLPELSPERAATLPGGFAILSAIFDSLKLSSLKPARGALREGALADVVGRMGLYDGQVREGSVRGLMRRTSVDLAQAIRVHDTALALREAAAGSGWVAPERGRLELGWAAKLHEIGLSFTHTDHHKLGAHLVRHADLAGFSRDEQALVAALVRTHRGKFDRAHFADLNAPDRKLARRLAVLLRVAVRLHRSRSDHPLPPLELDATRERLDLRFPQGFLERHPLTAEDLRAEAARLKVVDFELRVH